MPRTLFDSSQTKFNEDTEHYTDGVKNGKHRDVSADSLSVTGATAAITINSGNSYALIEKVTGSHALILKNYVNTPTAPALVTVLKSQDGVTAGQMGIHTFGAPSGAIRLTGSSVDVGVITAGTWSGGNISPAKIAPGSAAQFIGMTGGSPAWRTALVIGDVDGGNSTSTPVQTAVVIENISFAVSDESTALTAGTGKITFRTPYAFTVTEIKASLTVPQTSGSVLTVDVNENGTSIINPKLTFDNGEKTTVTATTAAVITDASLANDAEITVDIDQVGDGTAKGLKIYLVGYRT